MKKSKNRILTLTEALEGQEPPHRIRSPRVVKSPVPSEKFEQLRLVSWLQAKGLKFTHVVGNASSRRRGAQNKAMGMSAGFPDLVVLVPRAVLFIELKRQRGGVVSAEQKSWLLCLTEAGAHARVCLGFEKAKAFVEEFL